MLNKINPKTINAYTKARFSWYINLPLAQRLTAYKIALHYSAMPIARIRGIVRIMSYELRKI